VKKFASPEERAAFNAERSRKRALDPEKARAQAKARYAANPEPRKKAAAEYYKTNSEKVKDRLRKEYQLNPQPKREAVLRWQNDPKNKQGALQNVRDWYTRNTEKAKSDARSRRLADPDGRKASYHRRRQAKASGDLTPQQVKELREYFAGTCAYCFGPDAHILEHIVPLRRGGINTASNCVMACNSCNSRKWAHTLHHFMSTMPAWGVQPSNDNNPESVK
jgi:5-methylcytosine-specific restriction endonuclease McrA